MLHLRWSQLAHPVADCAAAAVSGYDPSIRRFAFTAWPGTIDKLFLKCKQHAPRVPSLERSNDHQGGRIINTRVDLSRMFGEREAYRMC